jgi:hypothetical protein
VHRERALGTGPCRECLSTFVVGEEERLLFTYDAFVNAEHRPQPGPVFIHAGRCCPYDDAGYPRGLSGLPVVAEAHCGMGRVYLCSRCSPDANRPSWRTCSPEPTWSICICGTPTPAASSPGWSASRNDASAEATWAGATLVDDEQPRAAA